jgi:hypothetical protein
MLLRGKTGRRRNVGNGRIRIRQQLARELQATLDNVSVNRLSGVLMKLLPRGGNGQADGPSEIGDAERRGNILLDMGEKTSRVPIRKRPRKRPPGSGRHRGARLCPNHRPP